MQALIWVWGYTFNRLGPLATSRTVSQLSDHDREELYTNSINLLAFKIHSL